MLDSGENGENSQESVAATQAKSNERQSADGGCECEEAEAEDIKEVLSIESRCSRANKQC